jgi:hypothetical protein
MRVGGGIVEPDRPDGDPPGALAPAVIADEALDEKRL